MFHPSGYDNIHPDGFSVLEILSTLAQGHARLFVPLKRTELTGIVAGPLAELHLTQTFGYTRQQCDKTLEAVYRFPLPGDAAVTGVTVRFGDIAIHAQLKERQHAEADYEEAKQQGKQAALATRESPDVFTLNVAGIQPDQDVVVETSYVQLAKAESSDWTLRIPLTTAPRYVRQDEANSRHAHGQPLALLRDPGHRFSLDLLFQNSGKIHSPTHALTTIKAEEGIRVQLKAGEVLPNRDCVLSWQPPQDFREPVLHVQLHEDRAAGQVYFLGLLTPPQERPSSGGVPREVILLLDHSGSMYGDKWETADWTVMQCLKHLTSRDTFALGLFHTDTTWFAPLPLPADAETVEQAIHFLQSHRDSGGTNLGVALEQALHLPRDAQERARQMLIVTDAEVSDSGRLLRMASKEAERASDRRRLSVICIDAAPNSLLVHELVQRGGGVAKFLTSSPSEQKMTTVIASLLEEWRVPLVSNLRLEINRPHALAVGKQRLTSSVQQSVLDLGDLTAGRSVWVAGRVPRGESPDLLFQVKTSDRSEIASARCDLTRGASSLPALKALFGAQQVLALEFLLTGFYRNEELQDRLIRLGYGPETWVVHPIPSSLYAENVQRDAYTILRSLLIREALDFGIACSETAFVAIREEVGQRIEQTVIVPNALPKGMDRSFLSQGTGNLGMSSDVRADLAEAMAQYGSRGDAARSEDDGALYCRASYGIAPYVKPNSPSLFQKIVRALRRDKSATCLDDILASALLFRGVPKFEAGEAVLYHVPEKENGQPLGQNRLLYQLELRFLTGAPDPECLNLDLALLLYIEDLAAPCLKIRMADLICEGGIVRLNTAYRAGQPIRLVLSDPAGVWTQNAPALEIRFVGGTPD